MNENPTNANEQFKLGCYYDEKASFAMKKEGYETISSDFTIDCLKKAWTYHARIPRTLF